MSSSTPSAWMPEIRRRPSVQAALITPTMSTIPISFGTWLLSSFVDRRDHLPGQVRERERPELRHDRERERDEQRHLVRAQEPEQAEKGRAVADRGPGRHRLNVRTAPASVPPRVRAVLPLESVPNFSEGRDRETIDAIGDALGRHARLLDVHSDPDHNRSVFTLIGDEDELVEALVAGIGVARERIDLRTHTGAHPRIGVADVVPIVPVAPRRPRPRPRGRAGGGRADRRAGAARLPLRAARPRPGLLPPRRRRRSSSGGSTPTSSTRTSGRSRSTRPPAR